MYVEIPGTMIMNHVRADVVTSRTIAYPQVTGGSGIRTSALFVVSYPYSTTAGGCGDW